MKGRTFWIAIVLAVLCLFAPGAAVLAEDGQPSASFWMELCDWLAALIPGPRMPDASGGTPTPMPDPLEAGILIPPSGFGDAAPAESPEQLEAGILIPPGG